MQMTYRSVPASKFFFGVPYWTFSRLYGVALVCDLLHQTVRGEENVLHLAARVDVKVAPVLPYGDRRILLDLPHLPLSRTPISAS